MDVETTVWVTWTRDHDAADSFEALPLRSRRSHSQLTLQFRPKNAIRGPY